MQFLYGSQILGCSRGHCKHLKKNPLQHSPGECLQPTLLSGHWDLPWGEGITKHLFSCSQVKPGKQAPVIPCPLGALQLGSSCASAAASGTAPRTVALQPRPPRNAGISSKSLQRAKPWPHTSCVSTTGDTVPWRRRGDMRHWKNRNSFWSRVRQVKLRYPQGYNCPGVLQTLQFSGEQIQGIDTEKKGRAQYLPWSSIQLVLQNKKKTNPNQTKQPTLVFKQNSSFGGKSVYRGGFFGVGGVLLKVLYFHSVWENDAWSLWQFSTQEKKNLHRGEVRVEQREHSKHSCELYHQNRIKTLHKNVWEIHGDGRKGIWHPGSPECHYWMQTFFFLGLAISFAMLEVLSYAKNYIQKHLSNQPRQRSREGNIIMFSPIQGRTKPR